MPVMPSPKTAKRLGLTAAVVGSATVFLVQWEGLTLVAKHERIDPPGVITVCNGITNHDQPDLKEGDRFTPAQCKDLLAGALPKYNSCIQDNIKVDLPPRRHAALLSFVYNVGCGNARKSSVFRKINAGDVRGGCDALLNWTQADGKFVQGLLNRRRAERELCLRND
jgi:lysozyme